MWSFYIILLARSVLQNFFSCFGFWLIFVVLCGRNKNYNQHKDFRAIWFGWELRFLVQIPAQRKVGGEVRAGCSGFPPLWCWKPPRMETSLGSLFQHYTIINLCNSQGRKASPTCSVKLSFQLMPGLSWPPIMHGCEELSCSPERGRLLGGHPEGLVSPGWPRLAPIASPHRAGAPDHLGAPPLNSLLFLDVFPVWGGQKWDAVF